MEFKKKTEKKEEEMSPETLALQRQVEILQAQILQERESKESSRLERAADELKKREAALEREADVKRAVTDAFSPAKTGVAADEELEQHELINIFGDALSEATKAQGDLLLTRVAGLVKDQDEKLDKMRHVILKLATHLDVEKARSSYSDFDDVKSEVGKIMVNSGLDAEDAYLLYKARIAKSGSGANPDSEKPGRPPSSPSSRDAYIKEQDSERSTSRISPSPKQIFRSAVEKAIEQRIAERGNR